MHKYLQKQSVVPAALDTPQMASILGKAFGLWDATIVTNPALRDGFVAVSHDKPYLMRLDPAREIDRRRVAFERSFAAQCSRSLGWPACLRTNLDEWSSGVVVEGRNLLLSGEQYLHQSHRVKSLDDFKALAEHMARFSKFKPHIEYDGKAAPRLDLHFLRSVACPKIIAVSAYPGWVEPTIASLLDHVETECSTLKWEINHGDAHEDNALVASGGEAFFVDTEFACLAPAGYDIATLIWDIHMRRGKDDALFFCRLMHDAGFQSPEVASKLTALMIMRKVWWLGLRASRSRDGTIPSRTFIEQQLEAALAIRMDQHLFASELSGKH